MKGPRVLVIEDDKPTLDQLVRLLGKEGFETTGLASGRACPKFVRDEGEPAALEP